MRLLEERGGHPAAGAPQPADEGALTWRAVLDAVADAPEGIGVDRPDAAAGAAERLMAWFAAHGLLEIVDGPRVTYLMPVRTRRLLHDLDHRVTFLGSPYEGYLEVLAALLALPVRPRLDATRTVEALLRALEGIEESPLSAPAGSARARVPSKSLHGLLTLVDRAPDGLSTIELVALVPGIDRFATLQRLEALADWGVLHRLPDTRRRGRIGRDRWRYVTTDAGRRMVADLADPTATHRPMYREALETASRLLGKLPSLRPGSNRTDEIRLSVRIALLLPDVDGPAADSTRRTLDALAAAPDGLTAGQLEGRTAGAGVALRQQLAVAEASGLVARTDRAGSGDVVHRLTADTPALLDELDRRETHRGHRLPLALLVLLLDRSAPVVPGSLLADEIGAVVRAGRTIVNAGRAVRANPDSVRALLEVLALAPKGGSTPAELTERAPGISERSTRQRLRVLAGHGVVEKVRATGPGSHPRQLRYSLSASTRDDLEVLRSREGRRRPEVRELVRLLDEPLLLKPGAATTNDLLAAFDELHTVPRA